MPQTVKLAEYLFTRLKQLGIGAMHGVPGDYNLNLLDYVEPAGLVWVGNANELNAGYAADGYARIKGFGALITTYGVGELSAINAIACAFTERAAVVHIVGTPPRSSQDARAMIHHTLGDGEYRHFAQMSSHVTVAQANLIDARSAPQQIDRVLAECVLQSRPVYIELPVDMVAVPVAAQTLQTSISAVEAVLSPGLEAATAKVLKRMYDAKQPIILVDCETRALGLIDIAQQLIRSTSWPTFTTASGNGLIDMTLPNVHGIYCGSFADPSIKEYFDGTDLVLCFGPHFSSTNSYAYSAVPKSENSILFTYSGIKIGNEMIRDVPAKQIATQILQKLDLAEIVKHSTPPAFPHNSLLTFSHVSSNSPIQQNQLWRLLANFLREGDIVMGETGTAGYGVREMALPKRTRVFCPITWLSIGYMLPASQGVALAQRELAASSNSPGRTILLIGDGSFQMTIQELGTIIRHRLNVVVFLINNDGYTIERCIHGVEQKYNDIPTWNYLDAPKFFGAGDDAFTASARTYGELQKVLDDEALTDGQGLRMVEIFMERLDAPEGPLLDLLRRQGPVAEQGKAVVPEVPKKGSGS
jgi:pyruvate decarboxylase